MAYKKPTDGLPNRIRHCRQQRDMTQQQLAERVHTTKATIQRLETGVRPCTLEWLRLIARALDCTVGELLSDADNPWGLTPAEQRLIATIRDTGGASIEAVQSVAETIRGYRGEPADIVDLNQRRSA